MSDTLDFGTVTVHDFLGTKEFQFGSILVQRQTFTLTGGRIGEITRDVVDVTLNIRVVPRLGEKPSWQNPHTDFVDISFNCPISLNCLSQEILRDIHKRDAYLLEIALKAFIEHEAKEISYTPQRERVYDPHTNKYYNHKEKEAYRNGFSY